MEKSYSAIHRYAKITPRKAGLILDMIRNQEVNHALDALAHTPKNGGRIVQKIIKNALSLNKSIETGNLIISQARADKASSVKRMNFRSRGRSSRYRKITSHILITIKPTEQKTNQSTSLKSTKQTQSHGTKN